MNKYFVKYSLILHKIKSIRICAIRTIRYFRTVTFLPGDNLSPYSKVDLSQEGYKLPPPLEPVTNCNQLKFAV